MQDYLFNHYNKSILILLKNGVIPWFNCGEKEIIGVEDINLVSGKPYHGINRLMLLLNRHYNGIKSNKWISIEQSVRNDWTIKNGCSCVPIIYWKPYSGIGRLAVKSYHVYNIEDCKNIPPIYFNKVIDSESARLRRSMSLIENFSDCPNIDHGYGLCGYVPSRDIICMMNANEFASDITYFHSLFHQVIHATGDSSRLCRQVEKCPLPGTIEHLLTHEEIIADIGTLFLSSIAGIPIPKYRYSFNFDSYRDRLINAFEKDNQLVVRLAYSAERAVRYILNEVNIMGEVKNNV
jgi:antirestriction protein ArdC